jgi:hypothetical protein
MKNLNDLKANFVDACCEIVHYSCVYFPRKIGELLYPQRDEKNISKKDLRTARLNVEDTLRRYS